MSVIESPTQTVQPPFQLVPVESPGGGRVRDKRDPAPSDVVTVPGVGRPVPLHRLAAAAWTAMVRAARADGIAAPLLLPTSGYRSGARQQRLYAAAVKRYGSPQEARKWVAPPGGSAHQSGRAIDFHLGGRNDSANVANLRRTPAYRWLVANAARFGFYPYEREPWHWEYNPPAAGTAPELEFEAAADGIPSSRLEWPGASPEALAFMRAVYDRHVARSRSAGGTFVGDLPASALAPIEGGHAGRRDAAEAARRMLAAARAALAAEGLNRVQIGIVSAYRPAGLQLKIWQGKGRQGGFPYYYRQLLKTGRLRAGDYGPQAVDIAAREMGRWIAAPGYSNHQDGLAIDFGIGEVGRGLGKLGPRSWLHRWLTANAQRFGFHPYAAEAWHWTYRPAKEGELGEVGSAGVRAGRLEVASAPPLAGHRGKGPAVVLRWNDMPAATSEVDVVVNLHGYSRPWLLLPRDIEPTSGLDLAGRTRPTLAVLPRGRYTGVKQRVGSLYRYTFPALDGTDGRRDGIKQLVQFALERFAEAAGAAVPRVGRLILTAHSGGGEPLLRILRLVDPQEVHVYDALYWEPSALAAWARRHMAHDRAAVAAGREREYMAARGGAMRVFYGGGTRAYGRQLRDAIAGQAGPLDRWYRAESSPLGHWEIPRTYGPRILADASADVPRATREAAAHHELEYEDGTPGFTKRTPSRKRFEQLVPLLDRHRGDIPLAFLLGWITVESDGRIDVITSLDERGFFQIHPDESKDRHFDHRRLSTDPDYSVEAGIANVRYYANLARKRFPAIPVGSELFWRVVKLQHALGSPLTKRLLDAMRAEGIPLTWDAIKRHEISTGPRLHRLLRVEPLGRFGRNVDAVFTRGRQIASALGR